MPADRDQARSKVEGMFRPTRRTDVGSGGAGNPHETWSDLKSLLHTSFILDTDSVFTVAAWTATRLIAECDGIVSLCSRMTADAQGLLTEPRSIEDLDDLDKASTLLNQALLGVQLSTNPKAATSKRTAAIQKISSFVQTSLAPSVDPSLGGNDLRSPSESRRDLRDALSSLLDRMSTVDDGVGALQDLTADVPASIPSKMAAGIIRDARSKMNQIRQRMSSSSPPDRTSNARDDLYTLAAGITSLGLLDRDPTPVLERGGPYTCDASGSGDGAYMIGAVSAPYRLIDGNGDALRLDIDGAGGATLDLPVAKVLPLYFEFPRPATWIFPFVVTYNVPAGPGEDVQLFANGIRGAVLHLAPGNYDLPTFLGMLIAVIPNDPSPPNNPYLLGTATLMGGGTYGTARFSYNDGGPVDPLTDLGACIGIAGTTRFLVEELGFAADRLVPDPTAAGFSIYRTFWQPVRQGELIQTIRDGFPTARIEPYNEVVMSGQAEYDPLDPDHLVVASYYGNGIWNADAGILVLDSDFRMVRVGDEISLSSTYSGLVTAIEPDGVKATLTPDPASGAYVVGIRPPLTSLTNLTLRVVDEMSFETDYRITATTPTADGRFYLRLSWNLYWLLYGVNRIVNYTVVSDKILIGSKSTGVAASFEVEAVASNAAARLGLVIGTVGGDVGQIHCAGADFVTDGVTVGDVVELVGLMNSSVAGVLGPTDLRLTDQIPGTFSGTVRIYNLKYFRHNLLLAAFLPGWATAPTQEDLSALVASCVRTAGAAGAAGRLVTMLAALSSVASSLRGGLVGYRSGFGELSPYMVDARNALEESGADRAVELLHTGKLTSLFSLSTDDASSSRMVLKNIRKVSRRLLGTSVYARSTELEIAAVQDPEQFFLDASGLPTESFGPPRSTRP